MSLFSASIIFQERNYFFVVWFFLVCPTFGLGPDGSMKEVTIYLMKLAFVLLRRNLDLSIRNLQACQSVIFFRIGRK